MTGYSETTLPSITHVLDSSVVVDVWLSALTHAYDPVHLLEQEDCFLKEHMKDFYVCLWKVCEGVLHSKWSRCWFTASHHTLSASRMRTTPAPLGPRAQRAFSHAHCGAQARAHCRLRAQARHEDQARAIARGHVRPGA